MTSDASQPSSLPVVPPGEGEPDRSQQVRLKSEGGKILLQLPPEGEQGAENPAASLNWNDLWQQLKQRLDAGDRFWQPNTSVHLIARDRLLDARQLQAIAEALQGGQLQLTRVYTSRRQTAVAAATAGYSVEQQSHLAHLNQAGGEGGQALAEPLYLETTLRSGAEIRHNGTVIVLGDVNPGGTILAHGDVLVWGRLRGVAHAGFGGNERCLIMALKLEPTQLRIAHAVARAPESPPDLYYPEVAYIAEQGRIRITRAFDFQRPEMPTP